MKINRQRKIYPLIISGFIILLFGGCTIKMTGGRSFGYSVTGASTGSAQTAMVVYFQNRAPIVESSLAQKLTDKLKQKIESQTNLKIVNKDADVNFEGSVESYDVQASGLSGGNSTTPSTNRLTITVKVKYNNNKDSHFDYESSFSRYIDAAGTATIDQIATSENLDGIVDKLVDDIFTKAFVNW